MASDSSGNQWYQPVAGLGHVGSYQVSGIPWVSSSVSVNGSNGSVVEVAFPTVTKTLTIKNLSANPMRLGFSANGIAANNYYIIGGSEVFSADLRVSKIYLIGNTTSATSASIAAGLTGISSGQLSNNWSGSVGVG